MSTDRDLANLVRSWLQTDEHESADRVLSAVFDRLDSTSQRRPLWRAWRYNQMSGTFKLLAAGSTAVLVAAIALGIYISRPAVGPAGSASPSLAPTTGAATDSPSPTASPTAGPTTAAVRAPFVVFMLRAGRAGVADDSLWAMRADGTGAQELYPAVGFTNVAWSQDGTKLLADIEHVSGGSHIYVADVGDVIGPLVDTGFSTASDSACNHKSGKPAPCQNGNFTFAPGGQRVAFTQACTYSVPGCGFITILDLRTGKRTELSATLRQGQHEGGMGGLAWSPDGTQIAFVKEGDQTVTGKGGGPDSNLWLIDANGRNLHRIDLAVPRLVAPQWSPDGKTIALMSDLLVDATPDPVLVQDVYTVKSDGSDLRQLTTDGRSSWPEWTPSGQIRFRIGTVSVPTMQYSLMDADGSNVHALVDLDGLLKAIVREDLRPPIPGDLGPAFLWQPASSWYKDR